MTATRKRRGVALIAMLTLIAAAGAVVATTSVASRDDRLASSNRANIMRSQWEADACAAVAISQFDNVLGAAQSPSAVSAVWLALDTTLLRVRLPAGTACRATLTAAGTATFMNRVGRAQLVAMIDATAPGAQSDSMADAFLDWRDADSVTRDFGAEAEWYKAVSRASPRNDLFRSVEELRLVRGWEHAGTLIGMLSADDYRIVLDRAPRAVLETVGGLPEEAIDWIDHHRAELRGRDVSVMLDHLSMSAQRVVAANYASLRTRTAAVPEAWYLDCMGFGANEHGMRIRLTLVRASGHVTVVKRVEESF